MGFEQERGARLKARLLTAKNSQLPPADLVAKYPDSAFIPLTKGKWTIVDKEDWQFLSQWSWYVDSTHIGYACRSTWKNGRTHSHTKMHRLIMGQSSLSVDHINGDGLDNRKGNLRFCTHADNMKNMRRKKSKYETGFKGVIYSHPSRSYLSITARIKKDGKVLHLGTFKTSKEAAIAYDKAAIEIFGEFARTNKMMGLL